MSPIFDVSRYKSLALNELCRIQDFMNLLMKTRNGMRWSAEDKIALRLHLRHAARAIPVLGIFTLPLGGLLLPLLALFLDRRKRTNRHTYPAAPEKQMPEK